MEEWKNPELIIKWILIAIFFFLILMAFIIVLVRTIFKKILEAKLKDSEAKVKEQKIFLDTTIQTQEKERKRIAADLHDDLIGKLTILKLKCELDFNDISLNKLIDESIQTARRISHDLSPPMLEYTSLQELLDRIVVSLSKKVKVNFLSDVRSQKDIYSNEFKIQFVRIVQESVTNIKKHANASLIDFHLRQSEKYTSMRIVDNGLGFDLNSKKKGLGLSNIETRVSYLKGSFLIKSQKEKGTSLLFIFKNLENGKNTPCNIR